MAGNEERPPIIVRGGSLVIQSGDERSTKPAHKKGKPWREPGSDRKRWKQKHDNGKHVTTYAVSFQGGGGTCSPVHATDVRVIYQLTGGDRVDVVIGRDKTDDSDDLEPLITSSRELTPNNEREQPTLTLPLDGSIVSISAGGNTCTNPVGAKLQPIGRTSEDRPPRRLLIFAAIALLALAGLLRIRIGTLRLQRQRGTAANHRPQRIDRVRESTRRYDWPEQALGGERQQEVEAGSQRRQAHQRLRGDVYGRFV